VLKRKRRSFTRAFKLSALARLATTENIVHLAAELGVERKLLYCWRDHYEARGSAGLRRAGRPSLAEVADDGTPDRGAEESEATRSRRRIVELERKIGQQQLDLDFFRTALRHVRERRRMSDTPGATASTRRPTR
jgi:transposase